MHILSIYLNLLHIYSYINMRAYAYMIKLQNVYIYNVNPIPLQLPYDFFHIRFQMSDFLRSMHAHACMQTDRSRPFQCESSCQSCSLSLIRSPHASTRTGTARSIAAAPTTHLAVLSRRVYIYQSA